MVPSGHNEPVPAAFLLVLVQGSDPEFRNRVINAIVLGIGKDDTLDLGHIIFGCGLKFLLCNVKLNMPFL